MISFLNIHFLKSRSKYTEFLTLLFFLISQLNVGIVRHFEPKLLHIHEVNFFSFFPHFSYGHFLWEHFQYCSICQCPQFCPINLNTMLFFLLSLIYFTHQYRSFYIQREEQSVFRISFLPLIFLIFVTLINSEKSNAVDEVFQCMC